MPPFLFVLSEYHPRAPVSVAAPRGFLFGFSSVWKEVSCRRSARKTGRHAVEIAEKALRIASGICVYTNSNIVTEEV